MRRAFTLIELLVVIAIVAVLAAILFPVFASAKAAAKATASLSNAKQIGTAMFLYSGDADDVATLDCAWDNGVGPATQSGRLYATWGHLLLPYMKSVDLFADPLAARDDVIAGLTPNVSRSFATGFGYDYTLWSPVFDPTGTTWRREPISMTSPADPSGTVLLASKFGRAEMGNVDYTYGPGKLWGANSAEPPDCYIRPSWCFAGWGLSDNYSPLLKTKESGKYTGGISFRRAGNAVVVFGDGHAVAMKPARLAAGSNYIDGTTTQDEKTIVATDRTKYLWDLE